MTKYALKSVQVHQHETSWIAPSADVIGNVALGRNSSIWFSVVIRGDNERVSIGECVNIQDGAILHSDPGCPLWVGSGTTVGHRVILHGCTIGQGCLIGMGAVIMNGADIGENSIVGANALITERKTFPPRSLIVGSPAKLVRELSVEEVGALHESSIHYVLNAQRFRSELSPECP